jgi:isopenicillin N synthase-like dioxygenase
LAPALLEAFSSIRGAVDSNGNNSDCDNHHHRGLAHTSILTLLGYRTGTRHKLTQKNRPAHPLVAAHTDVGVITLLLYDGGDCAVLQRKVGSKNDGDDEFEDVILPTPVPQEDPIFVVNVADCLSALTGNYLPSTVHRVMPQRGGTTPRNCLALFVGLDPDQTLTFQHGQVTYETWRKNRIAESQRVLQRSRGR